MGETDKYTRLVIGVMRVAIYSFLGLLLFGLLYGLLVTINPYLEKLDYSKVMEEIEIAFGKHMVIGVHDMGDGVINGLVYIDGANKSKETYNDVMVKTREFVHRISKYKKGSLKEIDLIIGLKHNVSDRDIVAFIGIDTSMLKSVDWGNITSYEELGKYLEVNLE